MAIGCLEVAPAQTFENNRVAWGYWLRDLTVSLQSVYLPDTALYRILDMSQQATMLALTDKTDFDIDTIITTQGKHEYTISGVNATMRGSVAGVSRLKETTSGGGEVALVKVPLDMVGRVQEGVIPGSYAIKDDVLILATKPLGEDTLRIYYFPVGNQLDEDTSAVSIAVEDRPAWLVLGAAMVHARDHQTQLATFYFNLWQVLVGLKSQAPQIPAAEQ